MNQSFAIFDMDGTLVDSMSYWQRLGREYLISKGVPGPLDEILERIKPMTMTESAALFAQECGLSGTAEELAQEMNAMMERHYRTDIPLKAGVREYLERLRRKQVTMCVASATVPELMQACLRRLGIAQHFAFLLSCETVGAGKHQPDVYHAAAKRLGAAPAEIAVYEDALYAAQTAKEAGYYVVGVYDASAANSWPQLNRLADETIFDWHTAAQHM